MNYLNVAIPRLQILLKSYEHEMLNLSCNSLLTAIKEKHPAEKVLGPVSLPTRRRIYCVLRSPHVNKDSREHFEIRTHKRLIEIHQPGAATIDTLRNLEFNAGIDIEVKIKDLP
jgi:small subunit ribosomal protein S10